MSFFSLPAGFVVELTNVDAMRRALFTALLGAAGAVAQVNPTVFDGISSALEAAGLTEFSNLAAYIFNTTEGSFLLRRVHVSHAHFSYRPSPLFGHHEHDG